MEESEGDEVPGLRASATRLSENIVMIWNGACALVTGGTDASCAREACPTTTAKKSGVKGGRLMMMKYRDVRARLNLVANVCVMPLANV